MLWIQSVQIRYAGITSSSGSACVGRMSKARKNAVKILKYCEQKTFILSFMDNEDASLKRRDLFRRLAERFKGNHYNSLNLKFDFISLRQWHWGLGEKCREQ